MNLQSWVVNKLLPVRLQFLFSPTSRKEFSFLKYLHQFEILATKEPHIKSTMSLIIIYATP